MKHLIPIVFLAMFDYAGGSAMHLVPLQIPSAAAQSGANAPQALEDIQRLDNLFTSVINKVAPSVVAVEATYPAKTENPSAPRGRMIEESGSGFIAKFPGRKEFTVLTNNHVIAWAQPDQIAIQLAGGRILRPVRVWSDPETDIAILGLPEHVTDVVPVVLGDSDNTRVGQWVLAIGSPFGLNQTVTHGILSAKSRGEVSLGSTIRIKDFLQTDAAINPGSSGGPLINLQGEVIGINTAIASHSGTSSGVAFSIPINLVKRICKQLLENGVVARGYLGMQLAPAFEANDALRLGLDRVHGALVEHVYESTPAHSAGLKTDDVVMRVEDVEIRDENHLINLISKLPPGQRVRLQVWRSRRMEQLDAVVGDWQQAQSRFQIRK